MGPPVLTPRGQAGRCAPNERDGQAGTATRTSKRATTLKPNAVGAKAIFFPPGVGWLPNWAFPLALLLAFTNTRKCPTGLCRAILNCWSIPHVRRQMQVYSILS